jgi:hypothetical protein
MRNVQVNIDLFADQSVTMPVIKHYVDTRHAAQPYVKYPKGFIRANCEPVRLL